MYLNVAVVMLAEVWKCSVLVQMLWCLGSALMAWVASCAVLLMLYKEMEIEGTN